MEGKRKPEDDGSSASQQGAHSSAALTVSAKRPRQDDSGSSRDQHALAISSSDSGKNKGLVRTIKRTSSLSSPIIALTDAHGAEVLDVRFSPDGNYLAAASADRTISLWETLGSNRNVGILQGHAKAVTALTWSPTAPSSAPRLFSASVDGTLIVWSPLKGIKERRLRGHRATVNVVVCTRAGREILASGSDDGKVFIWDPEDRNPLDSIDIGYPVTALAFSDDGNQLYVGSVDNDIHVYDLTKKQVIYSLRGHTDTITFLALSPSASHLLSGSLDSTLRVWDVRPFVPEPPPGHTGSPRLHRTLTGASAGFENMLIRGCWSRDGLSVAWGGGDRTVTIWDVEKSLITYKLPGHRGTCTAVDMHPREPIIVSASTDQTLLLGEVEV
ncbi:unnamed protein product [Tilletia controversa]|uniref:Uncharacterized protein n=3 Tax=Tilletia TaxID=13289 RepID=A0A8X7MVB8_9BASI|nr:hypothetical protein CF328_g3022 [Tilletia controversa]KAE8205106.1 hypothetical protein CF335_g2421 [Tilletia laevis]KAE8262165.1 hypothetical protein A4X03_0g2668 [Tilletia caries]KAE8249890.1 hypothetical protein A4X06_0g3021 [Tilletia controversa]CAD6887613.1 unnamed protein product [Tilletia caries]